MLSVTFRVHIIEASLVCVGSRALPTMPANCVDKAHYRYCRRSCLEKEIFWAAAA